jgi:hypothetical protein
MNRNDLKELHYIAPLGNLQSILGRGLLSFNRAAAHHPISIADPEVQGTRASKQVPGGLPLHDYVNLYFWARNAMLFRDLKFPGSPPPEHLNICVIGVSTGVLDLPDVVISDANAAADLTRFLPSPSGLERLEKDLIFAHSWKDENPIIETHKRVSMMAEVLVPHMVERRHLLRFYTCCAGAKRRMENLGLSVSFDPWPYLFFNQGGRYHD